MMKAAERAEEPDWSTAELISALEKLAHQKRLGTLVDIARLVGVDDVHAEAAQRRLVDAMQGFESMLMDMELGESRREARRVLQMLRPEFTASQVDDELRERFGMEL